MRWDAVLFDLDDTLYSRQAAFDVTMRNLVEVRVRPFTDEPTESLIEKITKLDSVEYAGAPSQYAREVLFNSLKNEFPQIRETVDELISWYRDQMIANIRPDPGLPAVIEALDQQNIPMGIITNGDRFQLRKLDAIGLKIDPQRIILSDEHGLRKPDRQIFMLALDRIGLQQSQNVLMVGDNPIADIQGAKDTGLAAAWLNLGRDWNHQTHHPDFELDSLADLADHLS